jgi:hypothetical protein
MTDQDAGAKPVARRPIIRAVKGVALFAGICALIFVLLEGVASTTLFTYHLFFSTRGTLPSRTHVEYDPEIGWVNAPGTRIDDMYGPGRTLTINQRGFRAATPDGAGPSGEGPVLICSGDSFTLGVGVAVEDTWCHQLAAARGLEYANLGHAGYGVGQIYLRYRREAPTLPPGIHVVAFIMDDVRRAAVDRFVGYAKPLVTVSDTNPVPDADPVPRHSGFGPWLAMNGGVFLELRTVDLASRVMGRFSNPPPGWIGDQAREPILAMFETIHREDRARGTSTVFVFLKENPSLNAIERGLSEWLSAELRARNLPFLDLTRAFYRLPLEDLHDMFDPLWGHYSAAGNALVAELLDDSLPPAPALGGQPDR